MPYCQRYFSTAVSMFAVEREEDCEDARKIHCKMDDEKDADAQMLELVTITRADTFVRNRLNMHDDFRALGEIDWLVKDDATAVDFAAFCHRVEKPPVGRLYQTNR